MDKKQYTIFSIVTGVLKGAILLSIILWLLPLLEINMPMWGVTLIIIAFVAYELITFRLGSSTLERKPILWSEAMSGRYGKAATKLNPDGYVQVDGEFWRAYSDDTSINKGDGVIVLEINQMTLRVALAARK